MFIMISFDSGITGKFGEVHDPDSQAIVHAVIGDSDCARHFTPPWRQNSKIAEVGAINRFSPLSQHIGKQTAGFRMEAKFFPDDRA